jgi:hypothetical protein
MLLLSLRSEKFFGFATKTSHSVPNRYSAINKQTGGVKMKFDKNICHVLATGVIAATFALSLGTSNVYASENESVTQMNNPTIAEENTTETIQTSPESTVTEDSTVDNEKAQSSLDETLGSDQQTETDIDDNDEEIPSLLPGDFFYFLKTMTEKIQLALTFDDVEKAELLANFAQERIAEAEALLVQGEEELAKDILEKALEQQELAMDKYGEMQKEETVKEQDTVSEKATDEVTKEVNDEATNDSTTEVDSIRQQLEEKFSKNILALQAALEKIENPKAKEVLAKNIAKAQEKLEKKINKKLAKLQKKELKTEKKIDELEEKLASGELNQEEYEKELARIQNHLADEREKTAKETTEKIDEITKKIQEKISNKQEKEKAEQLESDNHNDSRYKEARKVEEHKREEMKKQLEKQREEAKKAEERKREEMKKQYEKQREEARKAEEHKREHEEKEKHEYEKEKN